MDNDLPDSSPADAISAPEPGSRRRVLGAGFVGLAASLLPQLASRAGASAPRPGGDTTTTSGATTTSVAGATSSVGGSTTSTTSGPTTTAAPQRPSGDDLTMLDFAQQFELAAVELYATALNGAALGGNAALFTTLQQAHKAYAQSLAGLVGKTAPGTPLAVAVSQFGDGFGATNGTTVATAAYQLEGVAVATHSALIGMLAGIDGANLVASILTAEARHATVLADVLGATDLDQLLTSSATALEPTKG